MIVCVAVKSGTIFEVYASAVCSSLPHSRKWLISPA
jgi:hypothetical protein